MGEAKALGGGVAPCMEWSGYVYFVRSLECLINPLTANL